MIRTKAFLYTFLIWTLTGILGKLGFLAVCSDLLAEAPLAERLLVPWHGLRLDIAIAGYLTLIPGLLLIVSMWWKGKALRWIWKGYFLVASFLVALALIANIGLYGYWGFPLDNTSLLYIRTSPADALASMTTGQLILFPILILTVTAGFYWLTQAWPRRRQDCGGGSWKELALLILLEVLLILPIRGGIGTGTNHTGSVYFSSHIRLNHAAVNPVFSFMEAVLHQQDIGSKYRFMSDEEAARLFEGMTHTALRTDSVQKTGRMNVVLIGLESFSDTLMHTPGVTPELLKLTQESLCFRRFYANSIRTDRALVAFHSGLPAQPTMSIMDMPRKSASLPSIARTLDQQGYSTVFYYGGDINYSNMRSYFMGTGFQQVVCDQDFPINLLTSKWGVADGYVFDRVLADIKGDQSGKPFFRSVMTLSSHEPFDVPNYQKIKDSEVLNAFSYTDSCLGKFIRELKALPCWKNTIVAIVPDHLGAYPESFDNYQQRRFLIPFLILGGPIESPRQYDIIGSQIDIPATLLGMMDIDHSDFLYSKDLLDPASPHFAYFTFMDAMGMVTDDSYIIYDNTADQRQKAGGQNAGLLEKQVKAYLQKLYDDIDKR